jgi:cysteine desulfurase
MPANYYLDYNATTPVDAAVASALLPYLQGGFGNPSSVHVYGRTARAAIDEARDSVANLLGAKSKEIVFTSGGTESNNLAIFGATRTFRSKGNHIITCATEHHAVLHPCERLSHEGFEVTVLPVDSQGHFSLDLLKSAFRPSTILVSIMSANNETGTRHPIREIGKLCRERSVAFHCDAIQSFGKESVNVEDWNVDLLSLTAHKFYGPKGSGLLYVRTGLMIAPMCLGGFHENERRAGTENVPGIVGLAKAAQIASEKTIAENKRLFAFTEKLWKSFSLGIPGIHRNGDPSDRIGNTLNVSFEGCDGEGLLMGLDLEGICVSSGSACMVGSIQPSHVLKAMGLNEKLSRATVRFSAGQDSKEEDIPSITERVLRVIQRLR